MKKKMTVGQMAYSTLLLTFVGLPGFVNAGDVSHDEMVSTYTGTTTRNVGSSTVCWKNRTSGDDTAVAWKSSEDYAVFPTSISKFLCQWTSAFSLYGLKNEAAQTVGFSVSQTKIGAGGISLSKAGGGFSFGYYTPMNILLMTASQTWRSEASSGMGVVSVGYENNFHKPYTDSRIAADSGVSDLTISGRMAAIFYSPNNNLKNVTVRVEDNAEIVLPDVTVSGTDAGNTWHTKGKLNAKSVIFSGDGIRARFGALSPVSEAMANKRPMTVDVIDSAALAPDVTLDSGADLMVSNATFALAKMSVTGTGTSTLQGSSLVFTNDETEFAVAEGSRLALSVAPKAATGVEKITVTGAGALELVSGFSNGSLAGIDISPTATLSITGGEPLFMPVTGSGKILVSLAADAETYINDLSAFTGPVEVASGTLYLDSEPAGGVTTLGSGSVRYDGQSKYVGDTVVSADSIKVSVGETLTVGGNGLTAATRIWMNGGTLKVCRNAVVSASVTQDVTSAYLAADGMMATFSGVFCARTLGTEANIVSIRGGDVVMSGGFRAEGEKDQLYLYSGNVTFTGESGYFCSNFGLQSSAKKMIFDGTQYKATYKGAGSPASGLGLRVAVSGSSVSVVNGAALAIEGNRCVYFDNAALDIGGGSVSLSSSGSADFRNSSNIKLSSGGLFSTERMISLSENATTFDWQGGTFKPSIWSSGSAAGILFKGYWNSKSIAGTVNIAGSDCVLDMSGLAAGKSVVSTDPSVGPVKWVGTSGAKLAVRGPGTISLMAFTPNGMSIELGGKADLRIPELTSDFSLAELVVNAQDCVISTESTTVNPRIGTLRIGSAGMWRSGLLDGFGSSSWTDLAIDKDAILKFSPGDAVLNVPGTLTFGEGVRTWIEKGSPAVSGVVMTAVGGVAGNPTWTYYAGGKRAVKLSGNNVVVVPSGLCLVVR